MLSQRNIFGKKMTVSKEQKQKMISEHLEYEIYMLNYTDTILRNSSILMLHECIRNALIESFCTHARNLIEFFRNSTTEARLGKPAGSKHFTGKGYSSLHTEKFKDTIGELSALYNQLSDDSAHLSYARTIGQKKIEAAERELLRKLIIEEVEEFRKHLKDEYKRPSK